MSKQRMVLTFVTLVVAKFGWGEIMVSISLPPAPMGVT
jgi:hypothetical protein